MEKTELRFLLTREQAVERYGIPMRTLVQLYRCHSDFPVVRIGRSVRIHREKADEWFTNHIQIGVDVDW